MKILILSVTLFATLVSCSYNKDKTAAENGTNTTTANPETFITYDLIKTNTTAVCLRCHSGGTDPDLSTKSGLVANMSIVLDEVMSNEMPPPNKLPHLSDCQKATLQKWFDLGSPDTSEVKISSLPACALNI